MFGAHLHVSYQKVLSIHSRFKVLLVRACEQTAGSDQRDRAMGSLLELRGTTCLLLGTQNFFSKLITQTEPSLPTSVNISG